MALTKNFILSQIPDSTGHPKKLWLCGGCGGFMGYMPHAHKAVAHCSLQCQLRRQPTREEERDRLIMTLMTHGNRSIRDIGRVFSVNRGTVAAILNKRYDD